MFITVMDQAERKARISAMKENTDRSESIMYKDRMEQLPVIRIPIGIPIYRVRNGRTQVDQFIYIQNNNLPQDFFLAGQENESVQNVQHKILLEMSQDTKGPIYQELERIRIQTKNLIITADGVVVNGNRRLAAMRDLYTTPELYPEFSHVDAVVLPSDATENDIEMLEAELQLAPETKLEYGWIQRRLKLRHQLNELSIPRDKIKKTYRFRRDEDINVEIQQLALAEEYLEKFLGQPLAYKEVVNNEQIFKDMQKALSGKSGDDGEVRRLAAFLLVKESRSLGDRAYSFRDLYGKDFDRVMQRFAEEEGIELDTGGGFEYSGIEEDDPLSGLEFDAPSSYAPLKDVLSDTSKSHETAEKLVNILESVKLGRDEDRERKAALRKVQEALRLLNDVDISTSDVETHAQIDGQLSAIIDTASILLTQIRRNS